MSAIFKNANDFSLHIEQIVSNSKISYMDAVLEYCKENYLEPEDVAKLINKSIKTLVIDCFLLCHSWQLSSASCPA